MVWSGLVRFGGFGLGLLWRALGVVCASCGQGGLVWFGLAWFGSVWLVWLGVVRLVGWLRWRVGLACRCALFGVAWLRLVRLGLV